MATTAQGVQMNTAQPRVMISINQACELAQVTRRTVYNWITAGKVEYMRTAGGSVRIYKDTVLVSARYRALDLYRNQNTQATPAKSDQIRATVSVPQACQLVQVKQRTIYSWISSGKLEYTRNTSGQIRIYKDSLLVSTEGKTTVD